MSVPLKVKKRITPTNLTAVAASTLISPVVEEDDDPGPKGPRKNPNIKKVYGNRTKMVLERLHVTKLHNNSWIDHVKKFSEKNEIPYACALSNPNIKAGYEKGTFTTKSNVFQVNEKKTKRAASPEKQKAKRVKRDDQKEIKAVKELEKRSGGQTFQDRIARIEAQAKSGELDKRSKYKTLKTKALDETGYASFQAAKEKEAAKRRAHTQKIANAAARNKSR